MAIRFPHFLSWLDISHRYDDKFALVEHVTASTTSSWLHALEQLGADTKIMQTALDWCRGGKSVTLRLKAQERCKFNREVTRKVEDPITVGS